MLRAMAMTSSALDPHEIARARALLSPTAAREPIWPALAAAGFLAVSAMGFATAMVMAPPIVSEPVARGVR